ncbi:MAG: secretin N-terminal domain-containing protein [Nitrospiria bacterium]
MKAYWRIFILFMFIGAEALLRTNVGKGEALQSPQTVSTETSLASEADDREGFEGAPPPIPLADPEGPPNQETLEAPASSPERLEKPTAGEKGLSEEAIPPKNNLIDSGKDISKAFEALSKPVPEGGEFLEEFISLRRQGELFYMEFRNAEIKDVLRALSQENDLNIIIGERVEGTITLSFKAVTFDDAFNAILQMYHLNAYREGNIVRVIKSPFSAEEAELVTKMIGINFAVAEEVQATVKEMLSKNGVVMADARTNTLVIRDLPSYLEKIAKVVQRLDSETPQIMTEARIVAEEPELMTKMIGINFAVAEEVQATVKGILSKNGVVMADARTNTLVIRDLPSYLEKIAKVVQRLDSETPQIMIEARIVEVNTNFSKELGVQWGGQLSSRSGNTTTSLHGGGFKDQSDDLFSQPLSGGIGVSGGPFAVNLPADIGRGRGGAFGFSIGNVANTRLLDVQLSALEDAGNGKILSNPVIMTLNKKEARISSGTEILIPTTSIVTTSISSSADASGGTANTGVTTINAKLELTVTPHVTADDQIMIHVQVDKKDVDFSREVQSIPPLTTRTAETDLLVKDRETIVIGGIFTHNESDSEAGVPWLSKIPVLGWLFKKETKLDTQNELMIFLTPTIRRGDETIDENLFERNKNQ